jgi:putative ABC transport system permease protein
MRSQDTFFLAFNALKDRKLRSGLTILGITIGTSMIVALIASTTGLTANITAQISKMGVTTLTIMPTSARFEVTDNDVISLEKLEGVRDVIPYYSRRLQINYGSTTVSVQVYGLDHNKLFSLYQGLELDRGGLTDTYDPTGVIVGSSISRPPEQNLPSVDVNELLVLEQASTGRTRGPSYAYLVRGVLKSFGAAGFLNIDESAFISLVGARLSFKLTYYSGVYVIANSPEEVSLAQTNIQDYFGTNVRVMGAQSMVETVSSITNQLTIFMGGIGAVSLFVAGVGITNTMFVSIMERTREIGVLKAIGYRARNILTMFLAEASMTGVIGAFLGTIIGVLLSFLLSGGLAGMGMGGGMGGQRTMGPSQPGLSVGFKPLITSDLMMFSLLFPIGISIVAGLYPAWRASRLNIVLALKYE